MDTESALLSALHASPGDDVAWLALADWLEEQGEGPRAELLRLTTMLRRTVEGPDRAAAERRQQEALASGVLPYVPTLPNSAGITLALIPPGTFLMGSPTSEKPRRDNEGPQHRVTLTRGFYLSTHLVTQPQWRAVMDRAPKRSRKVGQPMNSIAWDDCQRFCTRLTEKEGRLYRLPSEAEWEYACRAGTTSPFSSGKGLKALRRAGWCSYDNVRSSAGAPVPVGQYQPNAFGLYDMHGNLLEHCADWYGLYSGEDAIDPTGPAEGSTHVLRGGAWHSEPRYCRSACRVHIEQASANPSLGLRLCTSCS